MNDLKVKIIVFVLLTLVFLLPFFSAQNFSPASDETTHIPSGYTYIKTGELKLNPQHPPLVKILAALPLTLTKINFDLSDPFFDSPLFNEWQFGKRFLASNDINKILILSRLVIQALSVLLAFYLYKWASKLFNLRAGILALFIYAFMPNIIAHAQFVTMDIAVSAFGFIAIYYLWEFFKTNRNRDLILSGIFLGLGLSSKFSAVVFVPVIAVFLLVYVWRLNLISDLKIRRYIIYAALVFLSSFLVVYALYFFPKDLGFYIRSMRLIYADWSGNLSFYLNGHFSSMGWWYYFIFAFLIKTPIPFLFALLAAVIMMVRRKYILSNRDKVFLLIPPIFFFVVTSLRAGNIGVRYILPVYPFLILYVSGLANLDFEKILNLSKKITFIILTILGVWYAFSALAYPDYLAYFNEFIGGSARGYKYLDDSNIEWGQDLKRLKSYQDKYPETKIIISWKNADPDYYGIKNRIEASKESLVNSSGRIAVNVQLLIHLIQKSQEYKDPALDWLNLYKPIDKIGQSFFIYNF